MFRDVHERSTVYECNGYRLPTEAEWEYAARAGTTTAFYSGDITPYGVQGDCNYDKNLDPIGWYCWNSDASTHPVGLKQPNAWGLYDMAGNAYEMANDPFHGRYTRSASDPWQLMPSPERLTLDAAIDSDAFMPDLRARIAELAAQFAVQILAEIRTASFEELAGYGSGSRAPAVRQESRGKRVRRTTSDLQRTLDAIVALVEKKPGLRSEQIQTALRLSKKDVTRPIMLGLQSKVLAKKGVKRATTYYSK